MDPQQELYTKILIELKNKGYSVFDGIAPDNAKYPFVCMGENQQQDTFDKSAVRGNLFQTIHVWHNNTRERGTFSNMMLEIKRICLKLENTKNFELMCVSLNQQVMIDTSTQSKLLHGVIDVEYKFS